MSEVHYDLLFTVLMEISKKVNRITIRTSE
jgi:hypothetical protein